MSDLINYFPKNPDPVFPGCRNSGRIEDGVVFSGFEPDTGAYTYIGRTDLIYAVGLLFGLSSKEVVAALDEGEGKAAKDNKRLRDALETVQKDYDTLLEKIRDLGGAVVV